MSGLSKQAISKRLQKGVNQIYLEISEVHTDGGLQGVNLIPESVIANWIVKDNPDLAALMMQAGVRVYLQTIAGFKVTSQLPEPPKPELPPADIRVTNLAASLQLFGIDMDNPRYKQGLQDLALDMLGITPALPPTSSERWLGVAERAEQLGYPSKLVTKYRSSLGRHVSKAGFEWKKEERSCNGTYRPINLYKLSDALDSAICDYMNTKL